ncbi:MAG TPA: DUF882 domain-containing protein [Burkholderiaceae bacterium]|jgi:uncharacterized protein YcbK (DUF882 family)
MKPNDRRRLLLRAALPLTWPALAGVAAAGTAVPGTVAGAVPSRSACSRWPRELWITRPDAQESTRAVYWADGALQPEGYRAINRIYRDLQANIERPISVRLLNLNYVLQCAVAQRWSPRPMVLLSGFRTPQTNQRVGGVEPSVHFAGEADDYIYSGLSFGDNLRLARWFQVGGLGVYPDRGSLHKDLGRSRTWIEYGRARPDTAREKR